MVLLLEVTHQGAAEQEARRMLICLVSPYDASNTILECWEQYRFLVYLSGRLILPSLSVNFPSSSRTGPDLGSDSRLLCILRRHRSGRLLPLEIAHDRTISNFDSL